MPESKQALQKSDSQHDYVLLDCSNSMEDKWWESLAAIDKYITTTRSEGIHSHVVMHMFYDENPDYIHRHYPIADWTSFGSDTPGPQGMTPLYDAINLMGRRLRELDPPRCSILIITDGENNASNYTTLHQAKAILDWCRAKGWQVTFIGADFSNSNTMRLLGAQSSQGVGVQKRLLSAAAENLAKKRARYGRDGSDIHFSPDEQTQFGGYLAKPGA